ncbi:hypothetical protein HDU76_001761 [Blyttiomyces sp. JEL0837]|nr:hypothetical protein HDU76_001761 [Blyttiomyces sp. JEL0837]
MKTIPSHFGFNTCDPEEIHKLSQYGIELPGTRKSDGSETGIYRNAISPAELRVDFPTIKTVYDIFQHGLKLSGNRPCLGHRPTVRDPVTGAIKSEGYVWQTYKQVSERRINFGCGLMKVYKEVVGGNVGDKFNMAIYSINRPEWIVADLAAHAFSICTVALYDTLGPETSEFILNHSSIPIVVTSLDKVSNLIKLSPTVPNMKVIICMDNVPNVPASPFLILKQWAAEKGVTLLSFGEVEAMGLKNRIPLVLPKAADAACISYTSGTTGMPKGAIITHGNLVAAVRSLTETGNGCAPEDVHISYLPLAHIYERMVVTGILANGACMGFFRGDVSLIVDDIATLRPTLFVSVPRLLNRIHDRIINTATSGSAFKAALFKKAVASKIEHLKKTGSLTHAFWDALVFNKVKGVLGGRLRAITSGSAPISADVLTFLRVAFGCEVLEGYGQTESTAALTVCWPKDYQPGHVGAPNACNEVKLVSVPEMSYNATDKPYPRGEIWVRGGNVFAGYYKDEKKTKETLTDDGWLKTGDIGYIDEKGRVVIIDRKKNIFKLSQGEYVAPEKIENVYLKASLIAQIFVHGDSLQSELVAIVVPDQEHAIPAAKEAGLLPSSVPNPGPIVPGQPAVPILKELIKNEKFRDMVMKEMNVIGKREGLRGFEFVKGVHLETEYFTLENGLVTPTMKLKRNEAVERYREQIDGLYREINAKKAPEAKL